MFGQIWVLLIPLLLLAGVTGAVLVAGQLVDGWGMTLWWVLITGLLLLPLIWVVCSALNPAQVDRRCPSCGVDETLVRPDRRSMLGVICSSCGYRDDEAYVAHLEEYLEGP